MPSAPLLPGIRSPVDLKKVPRERLPQVAAELRERIVQGVSRTGGHLASSLGVVELTIALHYVFSSPADRIVWDVGHQAYAHKILTGRQDLFPTLRTFGGISGFPRISESPYDAFGTGHSGTSISAALGMAVARDMRKERHKIIAVIGDGSLSSGLALEGLNQAGHQKRNLIVILNDNEWSISQNVGALSGYLNRIMTGKFYTSFRKRVENLLKSMPRGDFMARIGKKAEELTKGFIVPGLLFEELGFMYIGPISGHHIEDLLATFQNLENLEGPLLVHVVTAKGKGYPPAEVNPEDFHGVGAFDPETGKGKEKGDGSPLTYTNVFADAIVEIGRENPKVVAITAAMCSGTGLSKFRDAFPDRFFDVGIAEGHAVTFAAGLAREGKIPVVTIYSTFLQRAYDQIIHDVCLQKLPVVFAVDRGGIVGADGATHQGLFDLSFLRHIPNMSVMAPANEAELPAMLRAAVAAGRPAAIRYPRGRGAGVVPQGSAVPLEWGKGELLLDGKDVLILALGAMVAPSLHAAGELRKRGIHAAVVNARFVKPLDAELILPLARRTGRVVTVEENVLAGGFGSAVLEMFEEHGEHPPHFRRLGVRDAFVEHGSQAELREAYGLNADAVVAETLRMLGHAKTFLPSLFNGIRSRLERIV
ncbi:MAG TPA: 1-deoxy-D-xylulose-5-phosphate synthase [Candidatus Limnocylindrales bacterium]|nr:1-deoxy-D-xylulose-5-phosphate synthase [Candidatus Limnocylindrales bacterium]